MVATLQYASSSPLHLAIIIIALLVLSYCGRRAASLAPVRTQRKNWLCEDAWCYYYNRVR
jgi:hypothetical protein